MGLRDLEDDRVTVRGRWADPRGGPDQVYIGRGRTKSAAHRAARDKAFRYFGAYDEDKSKRPASIELVNLEVWGDDVDELRRAMDLD